MVRTTWEHMATLHISNATVVDQTKQTSPSRQQQLSTTVVICSTVFFTCSFVFGVMFVMSEFSLINLHFYEYHSVVTMKIQMSIPNISLRNRILLLKKLNWKHF